jgi:F-type H+-transporting ATPase subunit epsilon
MQCARQRLKKRNSMHVHIAKTNGVLWSGEVDSVVVPAAEGEVTILQGHTPLATPLRKGRIRVQQEGKDVFTHDCEKGVLEVTPEQVVVLV